ncbi:SGNH/GDSL hydrolase family protein [Puniceicoccaceae bacterium K14]|nr:SGNH/GDSL hydrolase family protein [Puniceicoccaceae bacterium K14]
MTKLFTVAYTVFGDVLLICRIHLIVHRECVMKNAEKSVMCFGDSNTWGCDPAGGARFDRSTRWPGVLQAELGEKCHVVEEGLGGRTTVWDDPIEGFKNGLKQLPPLLKSHAPLDLLIIMLGTNDLKNRFGVSAMDVSWSVTRLVNEAKNNAKAFVNEDPKVLVVCPPPYADMSNVPLRKIFVGAEEKSHQLAAEFAREGEEQGYPVFNAGNVIESSPIDGIHLEATEHRKLGEALAVEVKRVLFS